MFRIRFQGSFVIVRAASSASDVRVERKTSYVVVQVLKQSQKSHRLKSILCDILRSRKIASAMDVMYLH